MAPNAPPDYFPSLLELWDREAPTLGRGHQVTRGFRAALMEAIVVFVDLGRLTSESNRYAASPSVAADIVQDHLDLIEQTIGILFPADLHRIHLDKVLAGGFQLVIPGVAEESLPIATRLATAIFSGPAYPFRIGLHHGEVCLCDVGMVRWARRHAPFDEVTVMGPVVHLAARLAETAGDGELLILGAPLEEGALQPPSFTAPQDVEWFREVEGRRLPLKDFDSSRPTLVRVFTGRELLAPPYQPEASLERAAQLGRLLPRLVWKS